MDAQLKRGFLDICVLATLVKERSYGYKIINDLTAYVEISESTLYPILRRLEQDVLVQAESQEYSGRLRKYYNLTARGKDKLADFKASFSDLNKMLKFILDNCN